MDRWCTDFPLRSRSARTNPFALPRSTVMEVVTFTNHSHCSNCPPALPNRCRPFKTLQNPCPKPCRCSSTALCVWAHQNSFSAATKAMVIVYRSHR